MAEVGDHAHERAAASRVELADERAVDLDRVDRQLLEVGQGRIPGAEVVDGDLDAESSHGVEFSGGGDEVGQQDGLGDLDSEATWIDAGGVEGRSEVLWESVAE